MGMAFFGPALVLLTLFLFLPMILTLVFSFTDFFALNPSLTHFTGLDNYFQVFKDDDFREICDHNCSVTGTGSVRTGTSDQ